MFKRKKTARSEASAAHGSTGSRQFLRISRGNLQGTFLATISILSSISDQFSRAYSTILDLQEFCAPMKKLTVPGLSSSFLL